MSGPVAPVERWARRLAMGWAALAVLFLVGPLLVVVPLSLTSGSLLLYPLPGLSWRWYEEVLTDPLWTGAMLNTLLIGLPTTLLATVLGTLAAFGLQGLRSRWRAALIGLLLSPLVLPVIVYAVAAFYFFARIGLGGSYAGLIVAHTILSTPFVIVTVLATLDGLDASLPRAAAMLGAPPLLAFRRVTLPLILPGVASGAILAFVNSFDELVVTLFLAAPEQRTLPRQLWSGVQESVSPAITAAAVVLMAVSILLMLVTEALRRRAARLAGRLGV